MIINNNQGFPTPGQGRGGTLLGLIAAPRRLQILAHCQNLRDNNKKKIKIIILVRGLESDRKTAFD